MKSVKQYRRSVRYELKRLGHNFDFAIDLDSPAFEFEGEYMRMSTDKDHVKLHVFDAAKALWDIPKARVSNEDLIRHFKRAA